MKPIINNESNTAIATDLVLHKIYELEKLEKNKLSKKPHKLSNLFDSDGEYYRIPCELFSKIMQYLAEKGIIKSEGSSEKTTSLSPEEKESLCFSADSIEEFREFSDSIGIDFVVPKLSKIKKEIIDLTQPKIREEIIEEIKKKEAVSILKPDLPLETKNEDILAIPLKKFRLEINKNTGSVKLNNFEINFNPESQEFIILLKLATSKDCKMTYKDLFGDSVTKDKKRNLSFIIRNLKENLGILPKNDAKNEDIIKNIKNHGYRLIT